MRIASSWRRLTAWPWPPSAAEITLGGGWPLVVLELGERPLAGGRGLETCWQRLARAVRDDDREGIGDALLGLGAEPPKNDKTYERLRALLRSFFGPLLTLGPHRIEGRIVMDMGQMTKDKLALARLRLPGRLFFLLRIRFGLFAVLSRLGAVNDWAALEQRYVEEARPAPGPAQAAGRAAPVRPG